MKSIILFVSLFSISTWAAVDDMPLGSTKSDTETVKVEEPLGVLVEGGIMFDSMAASSSPMINAAIGKNVSENNMLMFNSAMPISVREDSDDLNLYKASGVWRYFFVNRSSRLYSETTANLYFVDSESTDIKNFLTLGWALGVTHMLSTELSIGGSAGFDFTQHDIDNDVVYHDEGSLYVMPKVAVNAAFHF